jgi:predicted metal-dependent phosphoesterase TrpH
MDIIDLHVHSSESDGDLSPKGVVHYAKSKGLRAIAITDHDTVDGIHDALEEGKNIDLEVISGVEISAQWYNGSMHLLGYYVSPSDKKLNEILKRLQLMRMSRNRKILERLNECGVYLNESHLMEFSKRGQMGRPHFARAMVKAGYVSAMEEAFQRYLSKGAPTYVDKERLQPEEAIHLITEAGGIPVLAHPYSLRIGDGLQFEARLLEWIDIGLMGIEGYYPDHDARNGPLYRYLGEKHDLIITGGTDFHGASKPDIKIGIGKGDLRIPYGMIEVLQERKAKRINP